MPTAKKGTFPYYMRAISTWHLDEIVRPGAVYFVLAALRGPDTSGHLLARLKSLITARLRFIVFKKGVVKGEYEGTRFTQGHVEALKGAVEELLKLRSEGKGGGNTHYVGHLYDAMKATGKHPIWGGFAMAIREQLYKVG